MANASTVVMDWSILDRMERAVASVRERLLRTTSILNLAGIPYAVIGGHAVASWVSTIDEGAVRNTRDVDLLVRRADLGRIASALQEAGFVQTELLDVVMFLDSPDAKPSESVNLLFASEKARPDHPLPTPELESIDDPAGYRVISLDALVQMKLLSNRLKDKVHLQDLIGVGLVDRTWLSKLAPVLAERLQQLLDEPE